MDMSTEGTASAPRGCSSWSMKRRSPGSPSPAQEARQGLKKPGVRKFKKNVSQWHHEHMVLRAVEQHPSCLDDGEPDRAGNVQRITAASPHFYVEPAQYADAILPIRRMM